MAAIDIIALPEDLIEEIKKKAFEAGMIVGAEQDATDHRGLCSDPVATIQSFEDWVAAGEPRVDGMGWRDYPYSVKDNAAYRELKRSRGQSLSEGQ